METPALDKIRRCWRRPTPWRKVFAFTLRFGMIVFLAYWFRRIYWDADFELELYLKSNRTHIVSLPLIHHSQYQPHHCVPIMSADEKANLKLAASLIATAKEHNYTTLTPYHVHRDSCLLVTNELSRSRDDYLIMVNPRITKASSPIRVQETTILCKRASSKEIAQSINISYLDTESTTNSRTVVHCPTATCAFALSHAMNVLHGKFKC